MVVLSQQCWFLNKLMCTCIFYGLALFHWFVWNQVHLLSTTENAVSSHQTLLDEVWT